MTTDALLAEVDAGIFKARWRPESIRDVEWCLEEQGSSEAEEALVDAQLADLIARATARADAIKARARNRINFFRAVVAEYAETHKDEILIGKRKSRDFIAGKVGWRKKGGKLVVTDKAALVEWVQGEDPSLFRVKVEPEMKALQALAAETGVIPPGCEWEPERDEVFVEATPLPVLTAPPSTKELDK